MIQRGKYKEILDNVFIEKIRKTFEHGEYIGIFFWIHRLTKNGPIEFLLNVEQIFAKLTGDIGHGIPISSVINHLLDVHQSCLTLSKTILIFSAMFS